MMYKAQTTPNEQHRIKILAFFALTIFAFSFASSVSAATLFIDPEVKNVGPGDTFIATIRLETTPEECVNAVTATIAYPPEWMNASAVSKGESLLSVWPEEPVIDREHGRVTFSGGIPAGYCGRVQGDPGKTNILAKIIFTIPGNMIGGKTATGTVPLPLSFTQDTVVLLNDGFGTPAPLMLHGAAYARMLTSQGLKNEWLDAVHADVTSPDLFTIQVAQSPDAFGGKYFIVFSAVDKQSGIHHYEVTEDDPMKLGFAYGKNEKAPTITASSPYVLTDQSLHSRIVVRTYDHAGNVQEAVLAPTNGTSSRSASLAYPHIPPIAMLGVGGGMLIIVGGWWLVLRRKSSSTPPDAPPPLS